MLDGRALLAITAVGANLTYGVWFYRANAQPEFATVALRGIRFIADYIANPAYLLLLPTGAAMVWVSGLGFHTFWIEWAMGLWLVAVALAYAGYSPALSKQIAVVVEEGPNDPKAGVMVVAAGGKPLPNYRVGVCAAF